jgi:hypothetical protein
VRPILCNPHEKQGAGISRRKYIEVINKLSLLEPSRESDWDNYVDRHPDGWICHRSEWKHIIERSFGHIRGHVAIVSDGDEIVAGMPIYEVKSIFTGKRLVSIPFATLSDPLVGDCEHLRSLIQFAVDFGKKLHCGHVEVRTKGAAVPMKNLGLAPHRVFKHHYLSLRIDQGELMKTFHPSCIQRRLRRVAVDHILLKTGIDNDAFNEFYSLYVKTRRKLGLPPLPLNYLKSLLQELSEKGNGKVYLALHEGVTIAGLFVLKFKNRVSVEVQCSDERYLHRCPNHFLYWEAIKDAHREGYEIFDFGRTDPLNSGLMRFKERWGTRVADLPIFHLPEQPRRKSAPGYEGDRYWILRKTIQHMPAPFLTRFGSLFYRHRA